MRPQSIARILALLLAVIFTVGGMAGCSDSPTAMKVGEEKVSYDLLRYFAMNYSRDAGHTAEEYAADPALAEELESLVHEALREIMAYRALAEEYDLELTEEEEESIQTGLDELKAQYADDAAFQNALAEAYMTEEVYRELQELQLLAQKVYEYLTAEMNHIILSDDATVQADVDKGNFFSAEYLYIYYAETDKDEKLAFAQDLHAELLAGTSMRELDDRYAAEYALSMEYVVLGAFTYTQQAEDFEEVILSLEEGAYSEPILRGDGILIARRLTLSEEYVNENFSDIIQSYKEREFAYYVREYGNQMEITYKSKYDALNLWEME